MADRGPFETPTEPSGFYRVEAEIPERPDGAKPLSADSLFHFTPTVTNLTGILTSGLVPRYCSEDISAALGLSESPGLQFKIPMVCFCDIPLTQAMRHMRGYGSYALGLSKEWGLRCGLAPVHYVTRGRGLRSGYRKVAELVRGDASLEAVRALLAFTKPYQGRHPKTGRTVRFYDECEWRYVVPNLDWPRSDGKPAPGLTPLGFSVHEVRYIIVECEEEKLEILRALERHLDGLNKDETAILGSRLRTAAELVADY